MGKETKDLLKKILSTQEEILAHLKMGTKPEKVAPKAVQPAKKAAAKPAPKKK